mgnify:CR=1 FL=1
MHELPKLAYAYDAYGRIAKVTSSLAGTWATLADAMLYQPATDRPYARRLGNNLARMEIRLMFEELLPRLADIQLAGDVKRVRSNFVNGIKAFPVKVTPA